MDVAQALIRVVEIEKQVARLQAEQARLVTRIVDDPCDGAPAPMLDKHYLEVELRVALGESATACNHRIRLARALVHRLPRTLAGMAAGELTQRHANAMANAVDLLDPDQVQRLESTCVPFAAGRDYSAFTRKIRRELAAMHTSTVDEQLQRARDRQLVWSSPDPDTLTATIGAVLPAADARTVMAAVETAADLVPADDRTWDQRRADGLVRIAADWLDSTLRDDNRENPKAARRLRRRHGPHVQVIVAASTLLGLDEQPGELSGHGPIPAALARELAADPHGTWQRLVDRRPRRLIDYGRTRYTPPTRLREFVVARDRECQFPGCHRQGRNCEIDHLQSWADGGSTNHHNLICLCRRHHHLKHDAGWSVRACPTAACAGPARTAVSIGTSRSATRATARSTVPFRTTISTLRRGSPDRCGRATVRIVEPPGHPIRRGMLILTARGGPT